jgi:integrase
MPRRLLTDRFCTHAKVREAEVQTDYFDEATKGLALRVSRSGLKSWTFHYTANGRRARLTFGNYPATSLGSARAKADEARSQGPQAIAKASTFAAICEEYLRRSTLRTKAWRAKQLERLVYPTLGAKPIDEVRRSDIVQLLDRIEEESGGPMADQTLAIVRRVLNWHASRSDDFRSPIVRGMARTKPKERARSRTLSDEELRAVWRVAEREPFGCFLQFVLLTATRRTEAANARRSEITGSDWIIPGARYKTGKDHLVPLSQAAQSLLSSSLSGVPQGGDGWIFSKDGISPLHASNYKAAFDKIVLRELPQGLPRWTLHDLRRTARSLMSRAGIPSDHAERCLGHTMEGVRGTYDRHEYYEEKRRAFEALASLVGRIVYPQPNVVVMRGRQ